MRTKFSTKETLSAVGPQMEKLVAWSKGKRPDEGPLSKLGLVGPKDIDRLYKDGARAAIHDVFAKLGGKDVPAPKLAAELVRTVKAEVQRVAPLDGDAATLSIADMKQMKAGVRPLALIALAYGHDDYFGSFADTTRPFQLLVGAIEGSLKALSVTDAKIVDAWLKFLPDDASYSPPDSMAVKRGGLPDEVAKLKNKLKRQYGSNYAVLPYFDPKSETYALCVKPTDGPNDEGVVITGKDGRRIADISIDDSGALTEIDPPHPRDINPTDKK